ncbi:MAG: ABC transporter permease, partial [Limisphaerales bacterium]
MERFIAIVIKEFRQILRDRLSLGMLIIVPALLLVLYGYALSFDVKHIPTAALDEDRTKESREFLEGIFQNPYFTLKAQLNRRSEIDELLMKGKAKVAIVVPRGFSEKINRGESVTIQALIDGADSTTGSTVHGYLDLIAARFNRRMVEETFAVRGGAVPLVRV